MDGNGKHARSDANASHGSSKVSGECPRLIVSSFPQTNDDVSIAYPDSQRNDHLQANISPQSHQQRQLYLSSRSSDHNGPTSQRGSAPVTAKKDGQNTRVVVRKPSKLRPNAPEFHPQAPHTRVCGDLMPENWHRMRQMRKAELGKMTGPQAKKNQDQATRMAIAAATVGATAATQTQTQPQPYQQCQQQKQNRTQLSVEDDVFVDCAQRPSSSQQQQQQRQQPTRSPSPSQSVQFLDSPTSSSIDHRRPRPLFTPCATRNGSQGVLPFVSLSQGRFLKLTQSPPAPPPIHVTRSELKPEASPQVKEERRGIKDISHLPAHEAARSNSNIINDSHSDPTMLEASRWASSSEEATPQKNESEKRSLIQPSKWATVDTPNQDDSHLSVTPSENRRRSPSNQARSSEGSATSTLLQPSKWATAETTPSKEPASASKSVSDSTTPQHPNVDSKSEASPKQSRRKKCRGRNKRPKSKTSTNASDTEFPPEEHSELPPVLAPAFDLSASTYLAQPQARPANMEAAPIPKTADQGFQIRGYANRSSSRGPAMKDASRNQHASDALAPPVPSSDKQQLETPESAATANDSSIETPLTAASTLEPEFKPQSQHGTTASSADDEGRTPEKPGQQQTSPEAPKSERRRRPSATYIPPHLRRRMQEEKSRQQAGVSAQPTLAHATAHTTAASSGIQIKGRGGRQPIALDQHLSGTPQHGHDAHQPPVGAVAMPMPEFITNRVLTPQEANPPPGFYPPPRSMRNPVIIRDYTINSSRTAYGFNMVPGGQASSWDQRFPRPPQYPQPPHQGQDPRMMPPHPMAQQQSFTPSSYPPYAPGMMGPQQMQQQQQQQQQRHPPGSNFMHHQQSKPATVGLQSSHVTPPLQTRTPEGFEQVSQNHLRYNPHHGETPLMSSTGHARAGTSADDLAEQLGAVQLNDKHGGRTSRGKYVSQLDPAKARDDLRAQEDEREKNRLRKLQSAKSRRWDARKDENGKVDFRKDKHDPERLALQRGPDRQKEDRERREMLLNNHLESDDDGVVYPEPGRLEPIDFGDEFEKKDDSSKTTPSGKHKDKEPHPPGYKLELRPLPDLIEPGKSWADMMDDEEEEWW